MSTGTTTWTPQVQAEPVIAKTVWVITRNGRDIGMTDDPIYALQMQDAGYLVTEVI